MAFFEQEDEINRVLGAGPIRDYTVQGPISVTLSHYRAGTEVFLEGELSARTAAVCARCAEEFVASSTRSFRYVLAPKALDDSAGGDQRDEDVEYSHYLGDEIDLSPPIREQLLLALPTKPLCAENCRGLCPRCGANLNLGACGCGIVEPNAEPRSGLAVLHSLKIRRA